MEKNQIPHKVTLSDRKKLMVTGVDEVVSFDDTTVQMETSLGSLTVYGQQLRLKNLSPEAGQLELIGEVEAMVYEQPRRKGGWFSRILG